MTAGQRVNQLRADAQPPANPAYAAFEHVAHAKLARDLSHIDGAVLIDERRVAGDDKQPADARQRSDQVFGNTIRKYSCSESPLMSSKGSTAMEGRSGSGKEGS
jgi:hypothetical protein